jgi:hypothetical protein
MWHCTSSVGKKVASLRTKRAGLDELVYQVEFPQRFLYDFRSRNPSHWPRYILYPQKLALTSPTSGGRSVGKVRSRIDLSNIMCNNLWMWNKTKLNYGHGVFFFYDFVAGCSIVANIVRQTIKRFPGISICGYLDSFGSSTCHIASVVDTESQKTQIKNIIKQGGKYRGVDLDVYFGGTYNLRTASNYLDWRFIFGRVFWLLKWLPRQFSAHPL